ncbi:Gfo/Idh/MocA family oxidoreductase [Streptomyces sp. M19]
MCARPTLRTRGSSVPRSPLESPSCEKPWQRMCGPPVSYRRWRPSTTRSPPCRSSTGTTPPYGRPSPPHAAGAPAAVAHPRQLPSGLARRRGATNWRVDPVAGGATRAFGDIGVHWCDLAEFVTGQRITRVNAAFARAVPARPAADGGPRPVATEDGAVVLLETDAGAVGSVVVSQASAGYKNALSFSFDGPDASYAFRQETPESLWIGGRDGNQVLTRDPGRPGHPSAAPPPCRPDTPRATTSASPTSSPTPTRRSGRTGAGSPGLRRRGPRGDDHPGRRRLGARRRLGRRHPGGTGRIGRPWGKRRAPRAGGGAPRRAPAWAPEARGVHPCWCSPAHHRSGHHVHRPAAALRDGRGVGTVPLIAPAAEHRGSRGTGRGHPGTREARASRQTPCRPASWPVGAAVRAPGTARRHPRRRVRAPRRPHADSGGADPALSSPRARPPRGFRAPATGRASRAA